MKRTIAITVVAALGFAAAASAQSSAVTSSTKPLAEVAKTEEARRQSIKKPAKVYTNNSLRIAPGEVTPSPAASGNATPAGNASPAKPATPTAPASDRPKEDQAYWQARIKTARDQVARLQMFSDSLQTRINSLLTDFVNRDNPVEKAKLEQDRIAALAELERVKKDIEEQQKNITAIEDEARRAGVPPGWLRPGA
jgi:hypothetical protein